MSTGLLRDQHAVLLNVQLADELGVVVQPPTQPSALRLAQSARDSRGLHVTAGLLVELRVGAVGAGKFTASRYDHHERQASPSLYARGPPTGLRRNGRFPPNGVAPVADCLSCRKMPRLSERLWAQCQTVGQRICHNAPNRRHAETGCDWHA